jgi:uncharacterized protein with FMN-binding domain
MTKIVLWLMSTVTVLVLLFGYHTSTSSTAAAGQGGNASLAAPAPSGTSADSGSSGAPSGGSTSSSGGSASAPTSASGGTASGTFTGAVASTRWGPVQVQITVANGKITKVSVPEYPNNNNRDQQINARALPVLVQETISAQSAHIDMVSGGTVTSEGYVESLQSALDKAGL